MSPSPIVVRRFQQVLVAHHEAGHAVADIHFRLPLRGVTIIPDGDLLGGTHLLAGISITKETPLRSAKDVIVAVLAGTVTEDVFFGRFSRGGLSDWNVAIDIAMRAGVINPRKAQRLVHQSEDAVLAYTATQLAPLFERTERFIRRHRTEIAAVARALLTRKRLDAGDVQAICRTASSRSLP